MTQQLADLAPEAATDTATRGQPIVLHDVDSTRAVIWGRETVAALALVVLCDLVIYRGHGFAGYAVLFCLAPLLILFGATARRGGPAWFIGIMLAALAVKMVWCGSGLLVGAGFALVVAFAMSLAGQCPYVPEAIVFASQTVAAGYRRLLEYGRALNRSGKFAAPVAWLSVLLPLGALLVFGAIFIFANPDWLESVWTGAERLVRRVREWLINFSILEVAFWAAVLWISAGLLRPLANGRPAGDARGDGDFHTTDSSELVATPLYAAFRNTLFVVIALFAVYLVFEFNDYGFASFPRVFIIRVSRIAVRRGSRSRWRSPRCSCRSSFAAACFATRGSIG
jgi:hypothetical protein